MSQTKASNNHPWVGAPALTPILDAETISLTREGRMFIPDVMTPMQFFAHREHTEPEHLLLFAVLWDAVECVSKPTRRAKDKLAAIAWFDDETGTATLPFTYICEVFNLEPTMWRRWAHQPQHVLPRHMRQMAGAHVQPHSMPSRRYGGSKHLHVTSIG